MFRNIRVNENEKCIDGLPEGWTTIFLADIRGMFGPFTFCAVLCPKELLPADDQFYAPVIGAKTALFQRKAAPTLLDVIEGYKVRTGGCKVTYAREDSRYRGEIHSYRGEHAFEGIPVRPDHVLVAL